MRTRTAVLLVISSSVLTALSFSALTARDQAPSNWKALELRCAQTDAALAEARLAQAQSQNKLIPSTIPQEQIQMLQAGVMLTRDRLQQLQRNVSDNPFGPQLAAATDILRSLELPH